MTTWVIATNTLGEALRKRILNIFLLVAIIMIILSQGFAYLTAPSSMTNVAQTAVQSQVQAGAAAAPSNLIEMTIIRSIGLGVIVLAGLVMSIFLGMDLIPAEIERRTIYTILSKPVRRAEYVCGKFLGCALTLLVNLALMGLAFQVLLFIKTHQFEPEMFMGVFLIYLEFVLLGAIALLFSIVLTRNINVALSFFVYIVGLLSDYWESAVRGTLETQMKVPQGEHVPLIQRVVQVIHWTLPNFNNFNTMNPLIHPDQLRSLPHGTFPRYVGEVTVWALIYMAVVLLIAALIFERREV